MDDDYKIESLLITDESGVPIYARDFNNEKKVQHEIVSGLISAINSMGEILFEKKIATIIFGEDELKNLPWDVNKVVFISKDLFYQEKHIFFVFFTQGDFSIHLLREISTKIFIEIKSFLKESIFNRKIIHEKVDVILDRDFPPIFELG